MKTYALRTITIVVFTVLLLAGCTKLQENVLDEASVTGQTQKQIADGLIAPVYARLPDLFRHTTYFALQEISTDEAILPYRGGTDWGDNGIYISLHRHETATSDPNVRETWNLIAQGLSRSITAISSLKDNTDPNVKVYIAEAKAMRAFYNWILMQLLDIAIRLSTLGIMLYLQIIFPFLMIIIIRIKNLFLQLINVLI